MEISKVCSRTKTALIIALTALALITLIRISDSHAGAGMIGSPHDFTPSGVSGQNYVSGICNECHIPHASNDIRLWKRPSAVGTPFIDNVVRRLCLDCHGYTDVDSLPFELPYLAGVLWGAGGVTPPQITNKDGTVFFNVNHSTGRDECTICHPHDDGFRMACDKCHGYPPGTRYQPNTNCPPAMTGAIEETPSTGNECNQTAQEVGAHVFHTLRNTALLDGEGNPYSGTPHNYGAPNLIPGAPKLGFTCIDAGCHVTILDHNTTVDYTAEVAFDLLGANGDPLITKDLPATDPITPGTGTGANSALGDKALDTKFDGTTQTGRANPLTTPMSCENIYCHSKVQKTVSTDTASDVWIGGAVQSWGQAAGTLACGSCHDDNTDVAGADGFGTNHTGVKMATGSHDKHVNNAFYGFVCTYCHTDRGRDNDPNSTTAYHVNGVVDINFNVTMGNMSFASGPAVSDAQYQTAYGTSLSGDDINLPGTPTPYDPSSPYDQANYSPDGRSGNCNNVDCHSDTMGEKVGVPNSTYASPRWGENQDINNPLMVDCTSCHGSGQFVVFDACDDISYIDWESTKGEPNYQNGSPINGAADNRFDAADLCDTAAAAGSPTANSHYAHIVRAGFDCNTCHDSTLQDVAGQNLIDYAGTHVNGSVDVVLASPYNTFTYDYTANGPGTVSKRCLNSCHGDYVDPLNAPQWGGAFVGGGMGCLMCHGATVAYPEPVIRPLEPPDLPVGDISNNIDVDVYESKGHGRTVLLGNYRSGNPPAKFNDYSTDLTPGTLGCLSNSTNDTTPLGGCHFDASPHYQTGKSALDPYRLGNTFNTDVDGLCIYCHNSTGESIISVIFSHTESSTRSAMVPAPQTAPIWPFQPKCIDCHDPHGDSGNDMMIRDSISRVNGSNRYGSPSLAPQTSPPLVNPPALPNLNDPALLAPVSFAQADPGYGGNVSPEIGQAGDYYNLVSDGPTVTNGICQVCHTQNLQYNNLTVSEASPAGEVKTHINTIDQGLNINPLASDPMHDFLSENGRKCTACHLHTEDPIDIYGFARPYISRNGVGVPLPDELYCQDCHIWNPNGNTVATGTPDHPLLVPKADGGLLEGLVDQTDDNDDIDDYIWGADSRPGMPDYTARAMIDGWQWSNYGHGTPDTMTMIENGRTAGSSTPAPGPQMNCDSACHTSQIAHGNHNNPFRINLPAFPFSNISDMCKTCHADFPPNQNGELTHPHADALIPVPLGEDNLYEEGVCTDCHDPHGDTARSDAILTGLLDIDDSADPVRGPNGVNAAMIQRELVWEDRWNAGGPTNGNPTIASVKFPSEDKLEPVARFVITNKDAPRLDDYVRNDTNPVPADRVSGVCEGCHRADGTALFYNATTGLNADTLFFRHKNADNTPPASLDIFHNYQDNPNGACAACHAHERGFQRPTQLDCFLCHGSPAEAVIRPVEPVNGIPNKVNQLQYEDSGHGRLIGAGNYPSSNPPAKFNEYIGDRSAPGCYSMADPVLDPNNAAPVSGCHFVDSPHYETGKEATDPYRFGNTFKNNLNALCTYCHAPSGQSSLIVAFSHTIDTTRANLDPSGWAPWPFVPKCIDCHDPHGDDNSYMVKEFVSNEYGTNLYGSPTLLDKVSPNISDETLVAEVAFTLTQTGPVRYPNVPKGKAGDYYNLVADGVDGICQVCHKNNLQYNNLAVSAASPTGEVKTHSNTINDALNDSATLYPGEHDFLSANGRRCTICHKHDDSAAARPGFTQYATNNVGFSRPYIDYPLPMDNTGVSYLYCNDCHIWNPNGTTRSPNHPLLVPKAQGGLSEGLADVTDDNDDVDNYTFGPGGGNLAARVATPMMPDYTDRAMIDGGQWVNNGKGIRQGGETLVSGRIAGAGSTPWSVTGNAFPCSTCHTAVDHGTAGNPFRFNQIPIETWCMTCHAGGSFNGDPTTFHADYMVIGENNMHEYGMCTDCHDVHGDSSRPDGQLTGISDGREVVSVDSPRLEGGMNAAFLQREVVWENRWTSGPYGDPTAFSIRFPTEDKLEPITRFVMYNNPGDPPRAPRFDDYVKTDTNPVEDDRMSGICEACHRADGTALFYNATTGLNAETKYFRYRNKDNTITLPAYHDQTDGYCTVCHTHGVGFQRPIEDPPCSPCDPPKGPECFVCHDPGATGAEPVVKPVEPVDGMPNRISKAQYQARGHGVNNTVTYESGNTGAAFRFDYTGQLQYPGCYSKSLVDSTPTDGCHFRYSPHFDSITGKDPTDPYRLGATFAIDTNGLCTYCHSTAGQSTLSVGFTHNETNTRSSLDLWGGAPPVWPFEPKCVDCHDPHGDINAFMIKEYVSNEYGTNLYGSPTLVDQALPNLSDETLVAHVYFNLTLGGVPRYDGTTPPITPGTAGDYYNLVADGIGDGICQVCHKQNMVYNNIAEAEARSGEVKTHSNWLEPDLNISGPISAHDFLSPNGRRCTQCHMHDDSAASNPTNPSGNVGFARPYADEPTPEHLYCNDCHLWNPNGITGSPNHPLLVPKAQGGLLEGLADPTDDNDDVDNYSFGPGGGDLAYRTANPSMPNFTDRAMIDGYQWENGGKGIRAPLPLLENGRTATTGSPYTGGIAFDCYFCHNMSVPHGDTTTPDPFRINNDIDYWCEFCHVPGFYNGEWGSMHADARIFTPTGTNNMYESGRCPDCHDIHGDTSRDDGLLTGISDSRDVTTTSGLNAALLQREVIWEDRWTSIKYGDPTEFSVAFPAEDKLEPIARFVISNAGAPKLDDYVKNDVTRSGICEACHRADGSPGYLTVYFRRLNEDGVDPATMPDFHDSRPNADGGFNDTYFCIQCHSHKEGFQKPRPTGPGPDIRDCFNCHDGTESTVRPADGVDVPTKGPANKISSVDYFANGHGGTAGYTQTLGDQAAPGCVSMNLSDPDNASPDRGCHATGAPHYLTGKESNDPYRLGITFAADTNGLCIFCHSVIFPAVETSHTAAADSTRSILTPLPDSPPVWPFTPKCVDCHDPHGDGNSKMIKNMVSNKYGSLDNGTPVTSTGVPNNPEINLAGIPGPNPDYDLSAVAPVAFTITIPGPARYGTGPGEAGEYGEAGDYYNLDADGVDGICQVCHTLNLVYNNIEQNGEVITHQNTLDPALNAATPPNSSLHDFLSEDGRRCTVCHMHDDAASGIRGFGKPYIDEPTSADLHCVDCHLWNPNGNTVATGTPDHPLLVPKAQGGLLEGLEDETDDNDDIDNYSFGNQPAKPSMPNFTDRAMIDGAQWVGASHGTVGTLPENNKNFGYGGSTAPGQNCNMHHWYTVNHGDPANPYRLAPQLVPLDVSNLCGGCHNRTFETATHNVHPNMFENNQCFDCHDVHGDTANPDATLTGISDANLNTSMMQREVVYEDRWGSSAAVYGDPTGKLYPSARYVATGEHTDFAKQDTGYSGICEACHDGIDNTTGAPQASPLRWFQRNDQDGDILPQFHTNLSSEKPCIKCHKHPEGFFVNICDCYNCHTWVQIQFGLTSSGSGHDINYDDTQDYAQSLIKDKCAPQDCLKCHDLDSSENHMDGTAHLNTIDGVAGITSPSAYSEIGRGMTSDAWGNTKAADPTGAWCGSCHDGTVPPAENINNNAVPPPPVSTYFTSSGHGAQDNSSGNFPRVAPNDANGRASCTGCHNYHASQNKAMVKRAFWNGSMWRNWNNSGAADYPINFPSSTTIIDKKELFCLEACHLTTDTNPPGLEFADVVPARTVDSKVKRGHYVFDYLGVGMILGTPTNYDITEGVDEGHNDSNWYFVSKSVGFVMGGGPDINNPPSDPDTSDSNMLHFYAHKDDAGEPITFQEDVSLITAALPFNMIDAQRGRALCTTCHDPHGSNVDTTWGNDAMSTDDQMLLNSPDSGGTWSTNYEPCQQCHQ